MDTQSNTDVAWCAGFFEGKWNNSESAISANNEESLRFFQQVVKIGIIEKETDETKQLYKIKFTEEELRLVINLIFPYASRVHGFTLVPPNKISQ